MFKANLDVQTLVSLFSLQFLKDSDLHFFMIYNTQTLRYRDIDFPDNLSTLYAIVPVDD